MANFGTPINFRIEGGGIFALNVDLVATGVGALKDELVRLGHITSRNVTLCRIDFLRDMEKTMVAGAMVKEYFGGEHYPNPDPNLIHILIKNHPTETTTSVAPDTDK